jgi:hypothetical protein
MTNHEQSRSAELSSQDVFDVLDRASSHQRDTYFQYHIGDGLAVRVGWIDIDNAVVSIPHLLVAIDDANLAQSASLAVDDHTAKYTRHTRPVFSGLDWLSASRRERYEARMAAHHRSFLVPTAVLAPVARAVANHDPYAGQYMSEEAFRDMLSTEPVDTTDINAIRGLIQEFSQPLD